MLLDSFKLIKEKICHGKPIKIALALIVATKVIREALGNTLVEIGL